MITYEAKVKEALESDDEPVKDTDEEAEIPDESKVKHCKESEVIKEIVHNDVAEVVVTDPVAVNVETAEPLEETTYDEA